MRGDQSGVTKSFRAIVDGKRDEDYILCINQPFYCDPHRMNLCIEVLCESKEVELQMAVAKWLVQTPRLRKWRINKKPETGLIPLPSFTRWGFTFDGIYFILNNYEEVKDFIFSLSEDRKNSLEKFLEDNHISWYNGEYKVDMQDRRFRTKFIALFEMLFVTRNIVDSLQDYDSKVFEKYEMIVHHIRDVFFTINQLKEDKCNDDEDGNGRFLLEEYYKNSRAYIIGWKT